MEVYTQDGEEGKLTLSKLHNKILDPYCIEEPSIEKSVSITGEPIRLFMEIYNCGKYFRHLFVKNYKEPYENTTDVKKDIISLKSDWNSKRTYSKDGMDFEMSQCKYYLYLVYKHITEISGVVFERLLTNVSDQDARTLRSMQKLLLLGHVTGQNISP